MNHDLTLHWEKLTLGKNCSYMQELANYKRFKRFQNDFKLCIKNKSFVAFVKIRQDIVIMIIYIDGPYDLLKRDK